MSIGSDMIVFLIVGILALSGVVTFLQGLFESEYRYDGLDSAVAMVQIPLIIWGVIVLYQR